MFLVQSKQPELYKMIVTIMKAAAYLEDVFAVSWLV